MKPSGWDKWWVPANLGRLSDYLSRTIFNSKAGYQKTLGILDVSGFLHWLSNIFVGCCFQDKNTRFTKSAKSPDYLINVIGSLVKKPLQLIYLSLHLLLLIWLLTCGRQGVEWLNDIKPGGRPFLSSPGSGFAQEISKEPSSLSEQPYCSVDHCSNCIFLSEIKMIW